MCSYPKCARSKSSSALIRQMRGGTNNSVRIKPTPERKARLHLNELMNSPKIAGVTDDAADTISYQRMSRLNCHQAAESSAQHKHWPDPQCTSSSEEYDTQPANRVTVNRPHLFAIGVCRQIRVDQSDYHEDGNDQRLPRASRTPGLRFPPAKNVKPESEKSTATSAISAG